MIVDRIIAWSLTFALTFFPTLASAQSPQVQQLLLMAGKGAPGGVGLMLDGITTGIKACYSTRKLLTAYAGAALTVTRLSDSTTQAIGFSSNVLDSAALSSFCTGTTCVATTWNDQCGGGFNHSAPATANAPILYQAGAINSINTKPALLGVSATPTSLNNGSLTANPVNTLWQSAVLSWTSGNSGITGSLTATGALEWRVDSAGTLDLLKANTASIGTSSSALTTATGAIVEAQYNSTTGAFSFWINRTAAGTGTSIQTLTAGTSQLMAGRATSGESFNGSIGEIIEYDLVGGIPGASQTSIENNQRAYWGTP